MPPPSITSLERLALTLGSGLVMMANPGRADAVAVLGDAASGPVLTRVVSRISAHSEGRAMLRTLEPCRFPSDGEGALVGMRELPEGSLGREYARFMDRRGFSPLERPGVMGFVTDARERWVLQRYRDVHDIWHVLTRMPTTVAGEVAQKWFEAANTGLPGALIMASVGPVRLSWRDRLTVARLVPWAVRCGAGAHDLLAVRYEDYLDVEVDELRRRWRISVPDVQMKGRKNMT